MRLRPLRLLPAVLAYGLAAAMGCAGAGTSTGTGGSSSPGTAGTSSPGTAGSSGGTTGVAGTTGAAGTIGTGGVSSPGSAGSSSPGTAGTTGTAGVSGGGSTGSAGSSTPGTAGTTGTAGTGTTGTAGTTGTGGTGGICQTASLNYEPKVPTVYLVVDRSGSMFHCLSASQNVCPTKTDTSWSQLKDAIESVITQLDSQVRFGFTTIFGTDQSNGRGGMCPLISGTLADNVAPAMNNAAAIKTKYDGLAWPIESESSTSGKKFESPAMYALTAAAKALTAITAPGDKYMIFITDGQEDYCDDALEICASDSTVGALQAAAAANIKTIVFGLQTTQFNLPGAVLDAFATAGAGEATVPSLMAGLNTLAIYDQCQGVMPWRTDLTASGHPTTRDPLATVGTYSTTAGPTKPFKPNASDQTMLVTQLSTALAGVKSCTFDLSDVGGKTIKVDTTKLNQAHVLIQGTEVILSATDGWNVTAAAPTTLVLSGAACTKWRMPNNTKIDLQFPCGTIIFE